MTTTSRRSVGFCEEPEIINSAESSFDFDNYHIYENITTINVNGDIKNEKEKQSSTGNEQGDNTADSHFQLKQNKNAKVDLNITQTTAAEVHSPVTYITEKGIKPCLRKDGKMHDVPNDKNQNLKVVDKTKTDLKENIYGKIPKPFIKLDHPCYACLTNTSDNNRMNESVDDTSTSDDSYQSLIKSSTESQETVSEPSITNASMGKVLNDTTKTNTTEENKNGPINDKLKPCDTKPNIHLHSEINISNDELPKYKYDSSLSYSSFPGHSNFIFVKANDWLKEGCKYDQDGFAVQSNYGHFDMKSKGTSAPWLSQFRRTVQHVYISPHGKVVENISVQDHDGKAFITSYHTNKELKNIKEKSVGSDSYKKRKLSRNRTCMFYVSLFAGTIVAVAITLLLAYTI
ncbi:uncharacterized protein LOC134684018 [Mytilus trossulus]|uniref:uncharacterized protein LOC134684018 n=1 Tax=Mytilus trossulus TaxID=6551 RepID=UPI003005B747